MATASAATSTQAAPPAPTYPPSSRYAGAQTYEAQLAAGGTATALIIPAPRSVGIVGYHQRIWGDRLDIVAVRYLNAPRGFWRLCDANNAIVAGALEFHALIGIPGS